MFRYETPSTDENTASELAIPAGQLVANACVFTSCRYPDSNRCANGCPDSTLLPTQQTDAQGDRPATIALRTTVASLYNNLCQPAP